MTLKEHMEVLHNKSREIFVCDQCNFKTNWARALKKHKKIHNIDSFSCSKCDFSTNDKKKLNEHLANEHGIEIEQHPCTECSYVADTSYQLTEHLNKEHSEGQAPVEYSCPDCDYKTKWKRLIKGHRRIHTGELFRCDKCDFATITRTRLNEHLNTHLEMSERSFPCSYCSYRATRQTRLNEHLLNRHYADKKTVYRCEKCGFSTVWKSYMKNPPENSHRRSAQMFSVHLHDAS